MTNQAQQTSEIEVFETLQNCYVAFKPYLDELTKIIDEAELKKQEFLKTLGNTDLYYSLRSGRAEELMESGVLWRHAENMRHHLQNTGNFSTAQVQNCMRERFEAIESVKHNLSRTMAYEGTSDVDNAKIEFRAFNRLLAKLRLVYDQVEAAIKEHEAASVK